MAKKKTKIFSVTLEQEMIVRVPVELEVKANSQKEAKK
jgi:hypothetical protein